MKLLSLITPQMKFTWLATALLGSIAASLAMRSRASSRPHDTRPVVPRPVSAEDERLKRDTEQAIDRVLSVKGSLMVGAENGAVTLAGEVLATDLDTVIKAVWTVPGLKKLITRMEVHDITDIAPELTRPRQPHRDSEIPARPASLDTLSEDASLGSRT